MIFFFFFFRLWKKSTVFGHNSEYKTDTFSHVPFDERARKKKKQKMGAGEITNTRTLLPRVRGVKRKEKKGC